MTQQCSLCTFRFAHSYINNKHLYHRKDDETGENIISTSSQFSKHKIFEAKRHQEMMTNDYSLGYSEDISDTPFDQFKRLYDRFPQPSRLIYPDLENADYASHCGWSKNIYLSYSVWIDVEDAYYSMRVMS